MMDFQTAVKTCVEKYFMFEARARRAEFWWFVLFQFGLGFVAGLIGGLIGTAWIARGVQIALFVPGLAVTARRLHDTDRSGWWQLISLTIIGVIPLIIWLATPGNTGSNRFGDDPIRA